MVKLGVMKPQWNLLRKYATLMNSSNRIYYNLQISIKPTLPGGLHVDGVFVQLFVKDCK